MFRKTVLATAIIGAGLGSMTGAAFAGDDPGDGGHHGSHSKHWDDPSDGGCSNRVAADSQNGSGESLGDTNGGDQSISPSNICHILTGNEIASNNNISGGDLVNGNTVTKTLTNSGTTTTNTSTTTG